MKTMRNLWNLWTLLCVTFSLTTSCIVGWFGSSCQFKCHCERNECDNNGTCLTDSKCDTQWFGLGCQFVDLTQLGNVTTSPKTDGRNDTCYSNMSINSVSVRWNMSYHFTWMRIIVNVSALPGEYTVVFTNNINNAPTQCVGRKTVTVNSRTLDIHCDPSDGIFDRVTLSGVGVAKLCSLQISGGRNVALKQNTTQSSQNGAKSDDKAVDGLHDDTVIHCSHTSTEDDNPSWTLHFSRPQLVTRYVIRNRIDCCWDRLIGFILTSFDENEKAIFNFNDTSTANQSVYRITSSSSTKPVSCLTINATNRVNHMGGKIVVLTLCEVEAYAESQCDTGKFGTECENRCNCNANDDVCFPSTGGCPSGCAAGYTGEGCAAECGPKKFGVNCAQECDNRCLNGSCNRISGICDNGCNSGYKPPRCSQECDKGYYGTNCSSVCPKRCRNNECNPFSGVCHACNPGYRGDTCSQDCKPYAYGQDCKHNCSENCQINGTLRVCNNTNGICFFGCRNGVTDCNPGKQEDGYMSSSVAGVVAGVLIVVLLTIVVAAILWRRRKNTKTKNMKARNSTADMLELIPSKSVAAAKCVEPASTDPPLHKSSISSNQLKDTQTPKDVELDLYYNMAQQQENTTAVRVEDLNTVMLSNGAEYFKNQFEKIPSINKDATMNEGLSAKNKSKNRYKNICAYDHSRVTLTTNKEKNEGDYINASFIKGYKNMEKFIASQAPTKTMINDFIRMLWEYKTDKVVMLTNLVEEGKSKCERYWPEDGSIMIGQIQVQLAATHVFADYTIRKLKLVKDDQSSHSLTHFHFTSWPDKGVPASPWPLVDFEQRVASYSTNRPIVVHCSAGVGRTGTYIALCNVIQEAKDTGQMDFSRTLFMLRMERVYMIQTLEQYIFLHKAAQMAIVCIGTTVSADDITDRIETLEVTATNRQINLEKEFKAICSVAVNSDGVSTEEPDDRLSTVYGNNSSSINKLKDRFSNIVPNDAHRPVLSCEMRSCTNYINAVLIPSFTRPDSQILTQLPLSTTIVDFWRLVVQFKVSLIVAFEGDVKATDLSPLTTCFLWGSGAILVYFIHKNPGRPLGDYQYRRIKSIGDYLPPSEDESVSSELFVIRTGPVTYASMWVSQDISIECTFKKKSFRRQSNKRINVTHLKATSACLDPENLLNLVMQIRSCRSAEVGRTLYMCRNGAEYSGLACVLTLLLDRMDNDLCLTVPLVAGAIKAVRPQVIPTLEQYRTLYAVLKLYTDNSSLYSNFGEPKPKPTLDTSRSTNTHTGNDNMNIYSNS